jgi:hypothetical protein
MARIRAPSTRRGLRTTQRFEGAARSEQRQVSAHTSAILKLYENVLVYPNHFRNVLPGRLGKRLHLEEVLRLFVWTEVERAHTRIAEQHDGIIAPPLLQRNIARLGSSTNAPAEWLKLTIDACP